MKKKLLLLIPLCCCLLLIAALLILRCGVNLTQGRCVVAVNGSILLLDGEEPICLSGVPDRQKQKLASGDRILVLHGPLQETYPAGTRAYLLLRLEQGDLTDIPPSARERLTELGYLGKLQLPPATEPEKGERVSYAFGHASMELSIPQGWSYEIRTASREEQGFGISFWPEGEAEGKLSLNYYEAFAVCGTGLEEQRLELGPYQCIAGTYDGRKIWDFISIRGLPGNYVFSNDGADGWYDEHEEQITAILESAVLARDMIWETQALAIGAEALEAEEADLRARFDSATGMWTVGTADGTYQVQIDPQGNVYHQPDLCSYPTAPYLS